MYYLITLLFLLPLTTNTASDITSDVVFECDFQNDNCGMVNQVGMRAKWIRQELDAGGRKGTMMTVTTSGDKKQLARMITPYFEEYGDTEGCLSLHIFTSGEGVSFFRVEKQTDEGFEKILSVRTQTPHWRIFNLPVVISQFVRFLFEAQVNPSFGKSIVAVDKVSFSLGECRSL